jgi:FdhD protein
MDDGGDPGALLSIPSGAVAMRTVLRRDGSEGVDALAVEEPLEIRVDGDTVATTMRTPGRDADLALGFLFAEGILGGGEDVGTVTHCGHPGEEGFGNVIDVRSAAGLRLDPERILEGRRFVPVSAACGVCGRRTIDRLLARVPKVAPERRLPPGLPARGLAALRRAQPVFDRTGGLHAAVLLDEDGAVLAAAEDVGRHNAVDKAIGALLRAGRVGARAPAASVPLLLAVSGRAGFEIVQKAAAAGVCAIVSVSAPSSLAVDLAAAAGVALAGFVRDGRTNVYANAWRLSPGS